MSSKNASDDVFVYLNAESERDDGRDARTTIVGIALLQLDDGSDHLFVDSVPSF